MASSPGDGVSPLSSVTVLVAPRQFACPEVLTWIVSDVVAGGHTTITASHGTSSTSPIVAVADCTPLADDGNQSSVKAAAAPSATAALTRSLPSGGQLPTEKR